MEPVEIDIRLNQNVDTESAKAVKGINDISTTSKTAVTDIGDTSKKAVEAASLPGMTTNLKQAIKEQQQLIHEITFDIKNLNAQLSKDPKNKSLALDLSGAKRALMEEQGALVGMQRQQLDADKASVSSQGNIIGSLGKWAAGIFSVKTAMEIGKKIMESTESTTHAFEVVTAEASAGTSYFFKTIASGDWSNFLGGMDKAVKGAKEYVQAMEVLENKTNEQKIKSSSLDIKIGEARAESYSSDPKVVKKALTTLIALQTEKLTGEAKIAKESYEIKRKKVADENNWNEKDLENTIKYYSANKEIIEKGEKYNELMSGINAYKSVETNSYIPANTRKQHDENLKELKLLGDDAKAAGAFATKFGKVTFPERNELADMLAKSQDATAAININNRRDKQRLVGIEASEEKAAAVAAKKVQDEKNKKLKEQSDFETELGKKRITNALKIEQEVLNSEADGSEKSRKQAELDYKKKLAEIEIEKADYIKKQNEVTGGIDKKTGKKTSQYSTIIPEVDQKQLNDLAAAALKEKNGKISEITTKEIEKLTSLYVKYGDERTKIEEEYNARIQKLAQNGFIVQAAAVAAERDKKISDTTASYIIETDAFKTATNDQLNLGKELNTKLITQIKERVAVEIASGKLTKEDGQKILTELDKSQAGKLTGSLGDYLSTLGKLKKAKEDLAKAKVSGDLDGAKKSAQDIDNLTKSLQTYGQKLQSVFSDASQYAGQAVDLLNSISKTDGDAASSAAKSISTVMNIATPVVSSLAKGDYVGATVSLITGTLTACFTAEKGHQDALKKIADAKLAQQKEYNDLLIKQNKLLKAAETIFGTDAYAQANIYANQMAKYKAAMANMGTGAGRNSGTLWAALGSAQVETGSHKTGLFGWGGEKADYTSLLTVYPLLIDKQGQLNQELAQSILDNQTLDDTSKAALQSALNYSKEYDEALANLHSYLNSVFGSLGDDLMTSIVNNLNNSEDAIDEFTDYVGVAIKKMINDIAESLFFSAQLSALQDKITAIYASTALTDSQKQEEINATMAAFVNNIDVSGAQKFISDAYAAWEAATGIDLTSSTRTGTTGITTATASQDSIDDLNGGVYALRSGVADIRNYTKEQLDINREQLVIQQTMSSQLSDIVDHTSFIEGMAKDINDIKIKGLVVKV